MYLKSAYKMPKKKEELRALMNHGLDRLGMGDEEGSGWNSSNFGSSGESSDSSSPSSSDENVYDTDVYEEYMERMRQLNRRKRALGREAVQAGIDQGETEALARHRREQKLHGKVRPNRRRGSDGITKYILISFGLSMLFLLVSHPGIVGFSAGPRTGVRGRPVKPRFRENGVEVEVGLFEQNKQWDDDSAHDGPPREQTHEERMAEVRNFLAEHETREPTDEEKLYKSVLRKSLVVITKAPFNIHYAFKDNRVSEETKKERQRRQHTSLRSEDESFIERPMPGRGSGNGHVPNSELVIPDDEEDEGRREEAISGTTGGSGAKVGREGGYIRG
jgi:hypothetical protein